MTAIDDQVPGGRCGPVIWFVIRSHLPSDVLGDQEIITVTPPPGTGPPVGSRIGSDSGRGEEAVDGQFGASEQPEPFVDGVGDALRVGGLG
jgi:hypothetical protein